MTRPSHRLGIGGELVPPGPNPRAQWLFLEAVRQCVPEAMRALAAIAPNLPDGRLFASTKREQEAPLHAWCKRFGFTAAKHKGRDWLLTVARRTARYLRTKNPSSPEQWMFVTSYWGLDSCSEAIATPRWDPAEQTESQFRVLVEAYIRNVKARAGERGWVERPEKRNLTHLEWLARYQVGHWTQAQIVEHYQDADGRPDIPAVSRALTDTAALIGLELRPAQGRKIESDETRLTQ